MQLRSKHSFFVIITVDTKTILMEQENLVMELKSRHKITY